MWLSNNWCCSKYRTKCICCYSCQNQIGTYKHQLILYVTFHLGTLLNFDGLNVFITESNFFSGRKCRSRSNRWQECYFWWSIWFGAYQSSFDKSHSRCIWQRYFEQHQYIGELHVILCWTNESFTKQNQIKNRKLFTL